MGNNGRITLFFIKSEVQPFVIRLNNFDQNYIV